MSGQVESAVKPSATRSRLAERLMRLTGDEWCGNDAPPGGGNTRLYVREDKGLTYVVSSLDDGGSVGIGWPNEWHCILRVQTARLFALWVLKEWVRRWFGLRDAVYFRALHRKVSGSWGRLGSPRHTLARVSSYDEWLREREDVS